MSRTLSEFVANVILAVVGLLLLALLAIVIFVFGVIMAGGFVIFIIQEFFRGFFGSLKSWDKTWRRS